MLPIYRSKRDQANASTMPNVAYSTTDQKPETGEAPIVKKNTSYYENA